MAKTAAQSIEIKDGYRTAEHEFPRYRYAGALKRAVDIAEFYGFRLIPSVETKSSDKVTVGGLRLPEDKVAFWRTYLELGMDKWRHPVKVAYTSRVKGRRALRLTLKIVGAHEPCAEALVLHTTSVILGEHGFKNTCIKINSIGNSDAVSECARELTSYYKKNLHELNAKGRMVFRKNVFELLSLADERNDMLREDAPKPINFLATPCRQHFSEVLEYLETLSIPYRLDTNLVGNHVCTFRTLFEIHDHGDDDLTSEQATFLGWGDRHDYLSQKLGRRKIPAVDAHLEIPSMKTAETIEEYTPKSSRVKVYLVQIGNAAKQRVLGIAELLRKARIPSHIAFHADGLSAQLAEAKKMEVPFIAIVGQKEITDGTVIIRSLETLSQETVPVNDIARYIKNAA